MSTTPDLRPSTSPDRGPGVGASVPRFVKALLPAAVLFLLLFVDFPLCPMRHLFGVPCPGCGLTRATESLFRGEVAAALAFHPMVPIVLPVVAWMLIRVTLVSAGILRSDSFDPLDRVPKAVWVGFVVVLLVVWIVRISGGLGGHPDAVAPAEGLIGRAIVRLVDLAGT